MGWLFGRSWWLLLVPVAVACAAVAQAIAVNRASGLLPTSWTWANGPAGAWLLVAATTLLTLGLAWVLRHAQLRDNRNRDQRDLTIKTDFAFQTTMALHRPPSARIRWTPRLDLFYSGTRALAILDIVPMAPARQTDKGQSVRFVRTAVASYYKAYPTFGAVAKVQDQAEDDFHNTEQWPLLVRPGQRLHVAIDQEFEVQLDGSAMSFESDSEALEILGLYFDLEPFEGSYRPGTLLLPTQVVTDDGAWEMDVPYLIMPVGSTLALPSREEIAEVEERDDLR
jgi:hypothetical protein